MTFQISIPMSEAGSESSGSSQSSSMLVNTIECTSINSGLNLINTYISKKVNLSHCKAIIFSEELASFGISEYIYTIMNEPEIQPDTNIIISRCDAQLFIKNSKPTLEQLSAKYYELASSSSEYTGYTTDSNIGDFFSSLCDTFREPYAILGNINDEDTHNFKNNTDGNRDSSFIAGETPVETEKTNIELMGVAVFSSDRFVGELNGLETICHQMITNSLDSCIITIPNPSQETENIDLDVRLKRNTKNKVDIVNGSPYISSNVQLVGTILSIDKNAEYQKEENIKQIEEYASSFLEQNLSAFLYKTSSEFHSDICGFGKYAASHFLYWKDWEDYNWLSSYKNSTFHVKAEITIRTPRTLLNS